MNLSVNASYLPIEIMIKMLMFLTPYELYKFMISCKSHYVLVMIHSNYFAKNFYRTISYGNGNYPWYLYFHSHLRNSTISNEKFKCIQFRKLLVVHNYASTSHFDEKYDNLSRMISNNEDYPGINLYECKLRYGLMRMFANSNPDTENNILVLCKYVDIDKFSMVFSIMNNYRDILTEISFAYAIGIVNYFNDTQNINYETIIRVITTAVTLGGNAAQALMLITCDKHGVYLIALACGVNVEDAYLYAISDEHVPFNIFYNFKAVLPLIGYSYAKYFCLDNNTNLNEIPHFLSVVNQLYTNGFECIDKCKALLKNPSQYSIERALSLRSAKRQRK